MTIQRFQQEFNKALTVLEDKNIVALSLSANSLSSRGWKFCLFQGTWKQIFYEDFEIKAEENITLQEITQNMNRWSILKLRVTLEEENELPLWRTWDTYLTGARGKKWIYDIQ